MPASSLFTTYPLEFEVEYATGSLWSDGGDVLVSVTLEEVSDDAVRAYDAVATMFFMLVGTGALSGAALEPAQSTVVDRQAVVLGGSALRFAFNGCRLDASATVLCVNAMSLEHARFPIRKISIINPKATSRTATLTYDKKHIDPYPQLHAPLPFSLNMNPDQESPTVEIVFAEALSAKHKTSIEDRLLTFIAASSSGVYSARGVSPADCFLSFSPGDLSFFENTASLTISQFRCHEAALRGLVNACAAIHSTVAPIVSVDVS